MKKIEIVLILILTFLIILFGLILYLIYNTINANAILKVAGSTQSCKDATLYITMSPCKECSKLIHQSGIKRVVYHKGYKDASGLKFLEKAGVSITHIPSLENQ